MTTKSATIETFPKGKRVGVNRDGRPVGYAVKVNRKGEAEKWTAFVNIEAPPFDTVRVGFASADDAVTFIAKNGYAR